MKAQINWASTFGYKKAQKTHVLLVFLLKGPDISL
jgi:hypothetical protein